MFEISFLEICLILYVEKKNFEFKLVIIIIILFNPLSPNKY